MRKNRVLRAAFGLENAVVEGTDFDESAGAVVVSVRPVARAGNRCGRCGRRSPRYDRGEGRRRWRALDLGTTKVFVEADAPRVRCRTHGPTVAQVPWARHDAGHTRDFDDHAAWLAVHTSKTAVVELLRIAWRTVKRGYRYLTVVVDHDTGRLVWAAPGHNDATLHVFFDQLGPERAALITDVSADMADWIARVVATRAPNAVRCADPLRRIPHKGSYEEAGIMASAGMVPWHGGLLGCGGAA